MDDDYIDEKTEEEIDRYWERKDKWREDEYVEKSEREDQLNQAQGGTMSKFNELVATNVNERTEKKGKFTYLSWPYAVSELRKADPKASWKTVRFDGMPFLKTDLGYFVEVEVTVEGVSLSQIHPVLDNRNKPIQKPTAFEINTSLQRCLVKAIALHGLGLYIYAGEDLPDNSNAPAVEIKTINDTQLSNIEILIEQTNTDAEQFCKWLKVPALHNINEAHYNAAIKALEAKRGKTQ